MMKVYEDRDGCRYLIGQYKENVWRIEDMLLGTYLSTDFDGMIKYIGEHGLREVRKWEKV
ncbi:hypothetical protein H7198_06000 [Fructobacillus sp. CRL 2054]|uniref:hypothetical protein n=1 Tax=Fructobacillus sp. CRL 2054 TaxID=2763007 RepID=UPI002379B5B3|nr:hypothetical protein [Fructobacillus sp. CRL 2054]MDD9139153.1 hypothetical protein [Fructobacillus sp. CRL 2054]